MKIVLVQIKVILILKPLTPLFSDPHDLITFSDGTNVNTTSFTSCQTWCCHIYHDKLIHMRMLLQYILGCHFYQNTLQYEYWKWDTKIFCMRTVGLFTFMQKFIEMTILWMSLFLRFPFYAIIEVEISLQIQSRLMLYMIIHKECSCLFKYLQHLYCFLTIFNKKIQGNNIWYH